MEVTNVPGMLEYLRIAEILFLDFVEQYFYCCRI